MPRIRSIKPEFFTSESVGRLSRDARLLLVGLISQADDEGRFRANTRLLAGAIFPYDEDGIRVVRRGLAELENNEIVQSYQRGDDHFGLLPSFPRHQHINRPSKSKLPSPEDDGISRKKFSEPSRSPHGALTVGSGIRDQGSRIKDQGSVRSSSKREKRKPKPAQPELPAMPPPPPPEPRAPSIGERLYAQFQENRALVLEAAGGAVEPDEPSTPVFVNTSLSPLLIALAPAAEVFARENPPRPDPLATAFDVACEDYWAMPWAAQCKPPFPFRAFVSRKIWSQFETITALQPTEEEMREGA